MLIGDHYRDFKYYDLDRLQGEDVKRVRAAADLVLKRSGREQRGGGTPVAAVVGTAVLLALPGALIGGQFTKGERADSSRVN